MLISHSWLVIAFYALFWTTIFAEGPIERLKVVIGFTDIEKLFFEVRTEVKKQETHDSFMAKLILGGSASKNPKKRVPEDLNPAVKERICVQIFSSGAYGKMGLERPVIPNQNFMTNIVGAFKYGYEDLVVHTPYKQFDENVFPCHITDEKNKVHEFYISEAYDVNVNYDPVSIGRFVLRKEDRGMLNVLDLAEQAAELLEDGYEKLENIYLGTRKEDSEIAAKAKENNLCKLEPYEQDQVCSSILNSSYFDNKVEYYKPEESRKMSCDGNPWIVEFEHQLEGNDPAHEEFAIVCAARLFNGDLALFMVSRGDKPDNVFIYTHKSERKIRLLNMSNHVRNVYEWQLKSAQSTSDESDYVDEPEPSTL